MDQLGRDWREPEIVLSLGTNASEANRLFCVKATADICHERVDFVDAPATNAMHTVLVGCGKADHLRETVAGAEPVSAALDARHRL
jgi:hypothetical protein